MSDFKQTMTLKEFLEHFPTIKERYLNFDVTSVSVTADDIVSFTVVGDLGKDKCASYRVRKVKTHLSDYEQGVYFGRYGVRKEYIENDEPYCMATRELESCNCDGDRSKCNFKR